LCGEIHQLHVHGYPWRRYRDRDSGENTCIRVISIICPTARAAGEPYTKRLLPDFLIPRCVIRLDHLLEAARVKAHERTVAHTCGILGCIDPRTARTHLTRLDCVADTASLDLAETGASTPHLGSAPDTPPAASSLERLQALICREQEAKVRAGDDTGSINLHRILQATMWKQSGNKPSPFASASPQPP